MSADVVADVMQIIEDLGFGKVPYDIYSPQIRDVRSNPFGILVEQRNTAPVPDVSVGCDTLYLNVQVRGGSGGEKGRAEAAEKALDLYRALRLIMDKIIGNTHYIRITPDSAPYEVQDGTHYDFLFGLEVVRYFQEDVE